MSPSISKSDAEFVNSISTNPKFFQIAPDSGFFFILELYHESGEESGFISHYKSPLVYNEDYNGKFLGKISLFGILAQISFMAALPALVNSISYMMDYFVDMADLEGAGLKPCSPFVSDLRAYCSGFSFSQMYSDHNPTYTFPDEGISFLLKCLEELLELRISNCQ